MSDLPRIAPPAVIAIMARMVVDIPKDIRVSEKSAPDLLQEYWARMMDVMEPKTVHTSSELGHG